MNCKPGDLAVVVNSFVPANLGIFVTVLEPLGQLCKDQEFIHKGLRCIASRDGFYWWVGSSSLMTAGGTMKQVYEIHVEDSKLRPIRDNPGNESWFVAAPLRKVKEVV